MTEAALLSPPQVELTATDPDHAWRTVAHTAYLWFVPRSKVLLMTDERSDRPV